MSDVGGCAAESEPSPARRRKPCRQARRARRRRRSRRTVERDIAPRAGIACTPQCSTQCSTPGG
ncbi:hypothetical protein WS71_07115 [Burkholderia mayonis]|uniref:Uncharacterized protein n=1 Tax=Burkholderia mayonis TaxID=1385591 RepID=A0A1B4FTV8_9BURK|nr:hypothetical protein WS71_07115 [Burkholderia mayonis]KVE45990.1 hypothetical protein WS71_23240 [Burkholderia mayonis]